jgi:hypothetical protein
MTARIFSRVVRRSITFAVAATAAMTCTNSTAQNNAGYYTDPATGLVYRQVTRTIDRPVVETNVEKREQTIYRPQTVTETKPESRTTYSPVVEYKWEPRMHGRWNPFQKPTIAYHHIPETRWEARNEVVQRTNTRTEWVAEKRTVEVPKKIVRMQREQKVDYEPVGRVAPPESNPPGPSSAIASRLRPLASTARVEAFSQPATQIAANGFVAPRIASSTVGRLTSDPPPRSNQQGGLRATDLYRAPAAVRGQALPPANGGTGIANLPSLPFFR